MKGAFCYVQPCSCTKLKTCQPAEAGRQVLFLVFFIGRVQHGQHAEQQFWALFSKLRGQYSVELVNVRVQSPCSGGIAPALYWFFVSFSVVFREAKYIFATSSQSFLRVAKSRASIASSVSSVPSNI